MNVKHLQNHKGVTLLELLISMAILGLLTVAFASIFLPVFNIGAKAAQINHGSASLATQLENTVAGSPGESDVSLTPGSSMQITLQPTTGSPKTITVPGNIAEGTDNTTGAKLKVFIPSK